MTPEQHEMVRRLRLAHISGCRADYELLGALPLDRIKGDIRACTDLIEAQAAELATLRADNRRLIGNAKAQGILDDIGAAGKSRASQARKLAHRIAAQRAALAVQHDANAKLRAERDAAWNTRATPPAAVVEAMERALRGIDDEWSADPFSPTTIKAIQQVRAAIDDLQAWRAGK